MRKNLNSYAIILLALLTLSACKKKESPPPQPAAQPKPSAQVQKPVQKQASSAKSVQNPVPQFEVSKMKDPFKPYVVEQPKPAQTTRMRPSPDALPIESYDLSRFKVAGIIVGMKENSALVIDPAGKGYVIKKGMTIGSNRGVITRITASAIEVDEKYVEENGRTKRRTVRLTLPQKK